MSSPSSSSTNTTNTTITSTTINSPISLKEIRRTISNPQEYGKGGRTSIHSSTGNLKTVGKTINSASFKKRKSITQALGDLFKNENSLGSSMGGGSGGESTSPILDENKIENIKAKESQRRILRRGTLTPVSTESRVLKEGTLQKLGKRYWSDKHVQLSQEGIIYYIDQKDEKGIKIEFGTSLKIRKLIKNGKPNCIHIKTALEDVYFHSDNDNIFLDWYKSLKIMEEEIDPKNKEEETKEEHKSMSLPTLNYMKENEKRKVTAVTTSYKDLKKNDSPLQSSSLLLYAGSKQNLPTSFRRNKKDSKEEIDEISISTIELLFKKNKTKEEEAYLLSLKEYSKKIKNEMKNRKMKIFRSPHVFVLNEDEKTDEEKMYCLKMYQLFSEKMKDKNRIYDEQIQLEILKCSKILFEKKNKSKQEQEYCDKIIQHSRDLIIFQSKYGVFLNYNIISASLILSKPNELRSKNEIQILNQLNLL
eukprot:gene5185-8791_t